MSTSQRDISEFINEFNQVFEGWSTSIEEKAKAFGQNRANFLHASQSKIKQLHTAHETTNREVEKIISEEEKENNEIENLAQSLQQLQIVEGQLPQHVNTSKQEHETLSAKLQIATDQLKAQKKEIEANQAKLLRVTKHYATHLGLEFRSVPGSLQCIFTLIDPKDTKKEFSFHLSLSDSLEYQVSNCQPTIPESEMKNIRDQVNKTNELGPLMKRMRTTFQKLV